MKKMKSGFTLAEVLITLGIIGVIAAIVMPSVMTNYTYKTVGVKLSKFAAQLEGATRPYVVQNNAFSEASDVDSFVTESLIIKSTEGENGGKTADTADFDPGDVSTGASLTSYATLKDGTKVHFYMLSDYTPDAEIKTVQVGAPLWGIAVDPDVSGLPKKIHKAYKFVVTELGYVYPDRPNDGCIAAIYDKNFETNPKFFNDNATLCSGTFKKGDGTELETPDDTETDGTETEETGS